MKYLTLTAEHCETWSCVIAHSFILATKTPQYRDVVPLFRFTTAVMRNVWKLETHTMWNVRSSWKTRRNCLPRLRVNCKHFVLNDENVETLRETRAQHSLTLFVSADFSSFFFNCFLLLLLFFFFFHRRRRHRRRQRLLFSMFIFVSGCPPVCSDIDYMSLSC